MDGHDMAVVGSIVARLCLAAFLLPAASSKLADHRSFANGVRDYALVPPALVPLTAVLVPVAELVLGLALMIGLVPALAGLFAALMLTVFIASMCVNALRGREMDCHCHGAATTRRIGRASIARNVVLFGFAAAVVVLVVATMPTGAWLDPRLSGWSVLNRADEWFTVAVLTSSCAALVYLLEWGLHVRHQAQTTLARLAEGIP